MQERRVNNDVPLTRECFQAWVKNQFEPHVQVESGTQIRVLKLEETLKSWIKIATVAVSIASVFGAFIVGLLAWALQEKTSELREVRSAVLTNQSAISAVSAQMSNVIIEIDRSRTRDEKMANLMFSLQERISASNEKRLR